MKKPVNQKVMGFQVKLIIYLGYLTVIDFSIYELVHYMEWMFGGKMKQF